MGHRAGTVLCWLQHDVLLVLDLDPRLAEIAVDLGEHGADPELLDRGLDRVHLDLLELEGEPTHAREGLGSGVAVLNQHPALEVHPDVDLLEDGLEVVVLPDDEPDPGGPDDRDVERGQNTSEHALFLQWVPDQGTVSSLN
ncbi:hypothetical protein COV05_01315 [Candidatus Uhrbacteria bacterium CG10_big_fil_rev_8_21_14_0_10_48_16]|uniref:Uncharacterized protein n=1 Tax=Candidatus Uhrbacteria bacterium CG10_big_fil_rev_8_21_14_0_10_48_16 TaxID=1975038 RepID=A0A2M8LHX5_9BACT|nr:MAG: hypothetical protein COV05_01315 [Candidatus Uhrbacteria bacterium CG10_big_fil_rev_8_21_14_0_10_48_16]